MGPNTKEAGMAKSSRKPRNLTIGLDLGDRRSHFWILKKDGGCYDEGKVSTTEMGLSRLLGQFGPCLVALEVGTHSNWICHLVQRLGHEVILANPRKTRIIFTNDRKSDQSDAEMLARLARVDPKLLHPVRPRSPETEGDIALIQARNQLVEVRTKLINFVRAKVKGSGQRVPCTSTPSFAKKALESLPEALRVALEPILENVVDLTRQIRAYDKQLEVVAQERYPEVEKLRQIKGVGLVTALSFVVVLEEPSRFERSRTVGAYLGLVPRRDQSGNWDPDLRITRAGNPLLRRLLVQAAHYMLGPFGEDSDLRSFGLAMAGKGGKRAKKRAVIAVARKLGVLLHRLWVTGKDYEPFHKQHRQEMKGRRKSARKVTEAAVLA